MDTEEMLARAIHIIRLYRNQHKSFSCKGEKDDSYGMCNYCRLAEEFFSDYPKTRTDGSTIESGPSEDHPLVQP